MSPRPLLYALAATALVLGACDDDPATQTTSSPSGTTPTATATVTELGDAAPLDHPPIEAPPASRSVKRLSVDQLAAALPVVAGDDANGLPITWRLKVGQKTVEALSDQALAPTLGKPDWIQVTEEGLQPSSLYLKFADDMARDVCEQAIKEDVTRDDPASRALTRFADPRDTTDRPAIRANLRYLKLRFLGVKVDATDDTATADLEAVFDRASAAAQNNPGPTGWHAVCVALLTDPAFHLY